MSVTFPVKVWCSKGEDASTPDSSPSFYLYSRVEGEEVEGFSALIEGTVQAVASEYFGTDVIFERCATQGRDGNAFNKWKITEVPIPGKPISAEIELALKQKHFALNYGLSPPQLDDLFPFHIVFDSSLNIVQSGERFLQLFPTSVVLSKVTDMFDIHSEGDQYSITWEEIQSKLKGEESGIGDIVPDFRLTTILHQTPLGHTSGLIGQLSFSLVDKVAVFLCSPAVSSLARMQDLGVVVQDLSKADKLQLQKEALSATLHGMKLVTADCADYALAQLQEALTSAQDKLITKQSYVRYVSHEIRTPLMVVDIGLQLLKKDLQDELELLGANALGSQAPSSDISIRVKRDDLSPDDTDVRGGKRDNSIRILNNSLHTVVECQSSMGVAISILNDLLDYEKIESGVFQLYKTTIWGVSRFFKDTIGEFKLQVSLSTYWIAATPIQFHWLSFMFWFHSGA
jgi:signal transduction histidine kinase